MTDTSQETTPRDCRTCGLLRETASGALTEHYMACGWQPDALPANALVMERAALRFHEHARLIPRKMLAELPHLLHPCDTWAPKR